MSADEGCSAEDKDLHCCHKFKRVKIDIILVVLSGKVQSFTVTVPY